MCFYAGAYGKTASQDAAKDKQRLPTAAQIESLVSLKKPQRQEQDLEKKPLTEDETHIFEMLRHWRAAKAQELHIPSYMICHNSELEDIARICPETISALSGIKGFGPQKMSRFAEEILAVLNAL